jgi:lysophospholipid acyltransferase (LPLAT)-like uncharacterized protein
MKDEGFVYQLSLRVVPALLSWLMRAWFGTCRVHIHGEENLQKILAAGKPTIATFWHYSLLMIFYQMRHYSGVAMVSSSRDGEYIARLAERLGLATVRGSRNRKGVQALKDMLKAVQSGSNAAIVADGSQGPPMIAQPGAILLASRSGVAILPMGWAASRYLTIRSWDRTVIPKLFSRVDFMFGEPLCVPPDLKNEGIEEYRLKLEQRLNDLYGKVWGMQGRTAHWPES